MSDYIRRDKLNKKKKYLFQIKGMPFPKSEWFFKFDDVMGMPSVDVRENIHGEWIDVTNGRGGHKCSICNDYAPSYQSGNEWLSKFCPNCGADMRGET